MNRIYKVIYSKARQCYIVVSELAKSNHKSSQQGADHTNTPALARIIAVALAAGALTWGSVPGVSWAADNTAVTDSNGNTVTKDINANITGKKNTVTDSSNAEIVGDGNTVTNEAKGEDGSVRYVRSNDARIHGSGNTISASRNQQVIGDNNTIMGRDDGTVTDYQHPEGREPNVSDLTIGRGNFIRSTDTYRNEWDSLKVIGNNNRADFKIESAGGPAAGIVIGDNQNIDGIKDSIVIGSLSPDEQKEQVGEDGYKSDKYFVGSNSVVVGYHATSSKDASTVIGNRSKVSGNYQTVTGLRSTIEGNYYNSLNLLDGQSGNFASIYGSFNKIEDATGEDDMDGVGNSINGSMNVTSNARGTMIMGVGNTVTHSKGEFLFPKDDDSSISTGDLLYVGAFTASDYAQGRDITGDNLTYPADQVYAYMRDAWQRYMETSGGAVSVLGNSNTSDYAIRSQILGTNNMLKGAEGNISSYNTISGFSNTGENVKRTAIVGTGNTLRNSEDNVVIGDYHNLENGKHNVILGSMASEEKAVTKTAKAAWAATDDNPDGTYTYTVNEQVALKPDPKVIENAVMVGYNTDVTKSGGVALGADSIASTEDGITGGITGFDALGKKHINSDKDYSTWVSTDAAVSVGGADREVKYNDKEGKEQTKTVKSTRQITNVAAGTQDTDAVNVAQLKAVSSAINTDITASKTHFYSVNSTDETADNYNNDGAKGKNSLAAGVGALANGSNSVAIGTKAKAQNDALAVGESANAGNNGIAIGMHANAGYGQNMALGYYASVANGVSNSTALGYGSQVTKRDILQSDGSDGVVSVGKSVGQSGEKGMTRRIINVKDGVKATDAANVSQLTELKEGEHISITDSATPNEKGQTVKTISVKVDGQIEKGNTGILSGDTVYKEVHVDKDGNYIKSGYTVAENLNALDGKVKTNADNIEKNGQAIEKNSARIDTNSKNIEKNGQAIETNSARIDTNSKNIEKNSQAIEKNSARIDTNSKNIEKNSQAIEKNSARIDTNSKNIETLQKTKADTNLSNITDAGKTVINNIAKKSVKVEAGSSNVSVTTKDVADGPITYTVDVAKDLHVNSITSKTVTSDSVTAKTVTSDTVKTKNLSVSESASIGDVTINKGNQGTIDDLKNTAWDAKNITSGRAATEDQVKAATKNAVNYDDDTSKTITLREDTTIKNVANTAIEQGSKNAVNAGTVYNETRVKQDGKYVKASNTAGENLSVLDNQVASNSSNITNLNGRVNNLDSKVNKVGAGAAALAALHPLDFDPEDKWDFAVGYGNYRDANSVAVGAFYRPDDDTMFSVGTNFGNGENMINAGVSFKFGPKGKSQVRPGSTQEITELRATVARQDDQLKKQDNEIKELKAMVQQLMAKQDKQATTK